MSYDPYDDPGDNSRFAVASEQARDRADTERKARRLLTPAGRADLARRVDEEARYRLTWPLCGWCGHRFEKSPTNTRHRFCSKRCSNAAKTVEDT